MSQERVSSPLNRPLGKPRAALAHAQQPELPTHAIQSEGATASGEKGGRASVQTRSEVLLTVGFGPARSPVLPAALAYHLHPSNDCASSHVPVPDRLGADAREAADALSTGS